MMYKCSECGMEYETSPKYCECGNDIFINVEDDFLPEEIEDFEEETEPERTSKYHGGRNFRQKTFSPLGLGVFVFCIILSLLVLFVIGNPQKDTTKITAETVKTEEIKIPSVESYWDDTPVKIAKKEELQPQKQENIIEKIVQQIVPQQQPKKEVKSVATVVKTPVATSKKTVQQQTKQQVKTTQKPQTQTQKQTISKTTPKTASNSTHSQSGMTFGDLTNKIRNQYPAQNTTTQSQSQTKPQTSQTVTSTNHNAPVPNTTKTTSTAQTQTQTTQKLQTQSVTNTPTQTQTQTRTATVPVTPQKTQAQLRQELSSYKSGLRNSIGRKIDFTRVIGDGECALSFKINSNGRLTSKTFTKQSSNITLNDAAFNALNTTTSYNPPPEGYNGETFRLTIKFYNGNFEIALN